MTPDSLPPAPSLDGELMLDVFTHPSLRNSGSGDNERYSVLGEQVYQAALTYAIFQLFPKFQGHEIAQERGKYRSDEHYEVWTIYYRLREKLRYHPSAADEVFSPKGARDIFHAYVGGAYAQTNGPSIVNIWIYNLLSPPETRIAQVVTSPTMYRSQPTNPSGHFTMPPPPPPLFHPHTPPPPPLFQPHTRSRASSISSSRQSVTGYEDNVAAPPNKVVFLPRFNQLCTQRRLNVEYPSEQGGLQHSPRWTVNCIVDGVHRGQGTATTKQLAKEEAAKQAWISFGWAT